MFFNLYPYNYCYCSCTFGCIFIQFYNVFRSDIQTHREKFSKESCSKNLYLMTSRTAMQFTHTHTHTHTHNTHIFWGAILIIGEG